MSNFRFVLHYKTENLGKKFLFFIMFSVEWGHFKSSDEYLRYLKIRVQGKLCDLVETNIFDSSRLGDTADMGQTSWGMSETKGEEQNLCNWIPPPTDFNELYSMGRFLKLQGYILCHNGFFFQNF